MRKIRLFKVVVPELVACAMFSSGEKIPDYRCPVCGMGAFDIHRYCGCCGSEFEWDKVETVDGLTAKECIKLGEYCSKGIKKGLRQIVGVHSPSKWD